MADQTTPSNRSAEAAKVADATVPDAKNVPRTEPNQPASERVVSQGHPLAGEPISRVQHADRAPAPESTTHRPSVLSKKDRERFEYLRSKEANPNVLPPNVRTEDEEHEFRKLSKVVGDAERQAALEAGRPEMRPSPKHRLAELKKKGQHLGEGETIERARIEALLHDEERIEKLKAMDKRVVEEDEELEMLQQRVAEARAAGGFDPNG